LEYFERLSLRWRSKVFYIDLSMQTATLIAPTARKAGTRSKVTNGRRVFAIGGDGRGAWTRRWKDLFEAHVADLGGPAGLSEGQVSLCRRVAAIEISLEQMEARMSEGDIAVDLDQYGRLAGHARRILETIGLKRVAKPVQNAGTTLLAYFKDDRQS
jgi:hypothetical protein